MVKRSLAVLIACGCAALVGAAPSAAAKPTGVCPPAFDQLTFAEALELAIETGVPGTPDEHLAFLVIVDKNLDETLCFFDPPDTPGLSPSSFIVIDNTAGIRK